MTLGPILAPGLQAVIIGTVGRGREPHAYYAGAGNHFWALLQASGLVPDLLTPEEAEALPGFGIGLTDLVLSRVHEAGREPEVVIHIDELVSSLQRVSPRVVAFVSKTAAAWCARGLGEPLPRGYGALPWTVAGIPAFVLPGPSGANNAMPVPLRTAMWRDLADYLDVVGDGQAVNES